MEPMPEELINGYLGRLGFAERPPPTRESLDMLVSRHLLKVPFENLDVQERRPIALGAERAVEKIVERRRGGFCFELNEAFRVLLVCLGFAVRRIEAQVWIAEERFGAAFDHLALVVTLDGDEFLVDVGFGDNNRAPMRLPDGEWSDLSGDYRLSGAASGQLLLSRTGGGAVRPLYRFSLAPQSLPAFAAMCTYHQTSPDSFFMRGVICTLATENGRITLTGDRLIIAESGRREERPVADAAARNRLLREHFEISV